MVQKVQRVCTTFIYNIPKTIFDTYANCSRKLKEKEMNSETVKNAGKENASKGKDIRDLENKTENVENLRRNNSKKKSVKLNKNEIQVIPQK